MKNSICFVTFHAKNSNKGPLGMPETLLKEEDFEYAQCIKNLFRSIENFHPCSEKFLLTTNDFMFSEDKIKITRINIKVNHSQLMLGRAMAQEMFLKFYNYQKPIIFIDSDMLINKNLNNIFENDFDIAVTWRKSINMPINGGLLIVNNKRPKSSQMFFSKYIQKFKNNYLTKAGWYGDQLALKDTFENSYKEMQSGIQKDNNFKVLFLSCDAFNNSESISNQLIIDGNQPYIYHFKGNRKTLQSMYLKKILKHDQ